MRLRTLLPVLLLVLPALAGAQEAAEPQQPVRYDGQKVVRVEPRTTRELTTVLALASSLWSERAGVGPVDVVVTPEALDTLREMGMVPLVLIDDVQVLIDAERAEIERRRTLRDLSWFENYKTNAEYVEYFQQLAAEFPGMCDLSVIGQSLQGRPIYAMRITGPGADGPRPQLIFNGCQHAREWVSPMVVTYIADQLLNQYGADQRVTEIMDRFEFLIVPMANPDGYIYSWTTDRMWRKNRRQNGGGTWGVDLNRNWDANWGGQGSSGNGGSDIYRGTAPFSEPETQVLRDSILAEPHARAHIDFHSFSQLILYPWGYTNALPPEPDYTRFVQFGLQMAAAILQVHGKVYTPQRAIELYAASGIMSDWTYIAGLLGFTIELRPLTSVPGFLLPPEEILPTSEENFAAILTLAESVRALPATISFPDGTPAFVEAGAPAAVAVQIDPGGGVLAEGTPTLWKRIRYGDNFTSAPLAPIGGRLYEATLPAANCGGTIEFYLTAQLTDGTVITHPELGADDPIVVKAQQVIFADNFDTDKGWTAGAPDDDATTGHWTRMPPEQTQNNQGQIAQPGWVVSGSNCWVTDGRAGNSIGQYDVDNGKTTLFSPVFDLSDTYDPVVSYWRWYSNHAGANPYNDIFVVDVSNDGGATWTNVETVGPSGPEVEGGWHFVEHRLADVIEPTDAVRLRFVASDYDPQAIVEACIDDFKLRTTCPLRPGDYNGDTVVDTLDFLAFLNDWVAGNPKADWNGDGKIDTLDFLAFLNDWVQG